MAAADAAAISSGVPAAVLMDRAGRAVARAVIRAAGGRYGRRVAVVCGKGNNGGDGFVAARVLAGAGLGVRCLMIGDASLLQGAANEHLELMRGATVPTEGFDAALLDGCDVVVDALFGTGFKGRAAGEAAEAIEAINASDAAIVAVDIPSGVAGATGAVDGPAVAADTTVVMGAEKIGTAVGAGASLSGRVEVVDIGIEAGGARAWMLERDDVAGVLPRRAFESHKRSLGAVAILGGSAGMSGAVILSARAAVRAGAGYATVGVTAEVDRIVARALPEILSRVVTGGDALDAGALDAFKDVIERATAVAIGPGLGAGAPQGVLVDSVLSDIDAPVVVDADALNVLAGRSGALEARSAPCVLTPHPAELARLLACSAEDVQTDRIGAARGAAERFGCVVVLKGSRSVIAEPSGTAVVNPTGGPELASAGTGDVLTGAVAALLAAGLPPFEAAWAAVYTHGVAGGLAARRAGGINVLAWDVAEALPEAAALGGR